MANTLLSNLVSSALTGPVGATGPIGVGATGPIGLGATGAVRSWAPLTSNYTAINNDRLIADTTAGSFTVYLPATPNSGDYVQITDGADWTVHNLTVNRNGSSIENHNDDLLLTVQGVTVEFIYTGLTWQITATTGAKGNPGATGAMPLSYESISKNLNTYPYTITRTGNLISTITYTTPSGNYVKSYNYVQGVLSYVTISGTPLGSSVYTKTLNYVSGVITSVSYSVV
jgi:hypothetical protein